MQQKARAKTNPIVLRSVNGWEIWRFDYASRSSRNTVRINSCVNIAGSSNSEKMLKRSYDQASHSTSRRGLINRRRPLMNPRASDYESNEYGQTRRRETTHMHYRGYKWMWERIKKEGIKRKEEGIFFYMRRRDEFSLAKLHRQIFSFYTSQRTDIRNCKVAQWMLTIEITIQTMLYNITARL